MININTLTEEEFKELSPFDKAKLCGVTIEEMESAYQTLSKEPNLTEFYKKIIEIISRE